MQALRVRGFGRLASTYALNELADWFAAIALSILVFDATGSAWATTALFLANKFAPGLLVPGLAARLEHIRIARLLGGVYVVEAVVLGALAVAAGSFWLPAVLALALVDGTLAAVARAATRGATPAIMEPHGLLREANATLNIAFAATNAAAPMAAGALVALTSPGPVLAAAAALFLLQAVLIGTSRDLPVADVEPAPWRERLGEALRYVRSRPALRTLLVMESAVVVLATMVAPIEVVLAKDTLDAGDIGFGALAASWGVGMLGGSWLFARETRRSILGLIAAATGAVGVGYLGMAVAPTIAVACLAAAVGGLGNGVQWVAVITAVQEATEARFQARVAGLTEMILTIAPGIGFTFGGAVTALLSPRAAVAVAGAGVLVLLGAGALLMGGRTFGEPTPSRAPAP